MEIIIRLRILLWISVLANGFLLTEAEEKCGGIPYADGTGRQMSLHRGMYGASPFWFHNHKLTFKLD